MTPSTVNRLRAIGRAGRWRRFTPGSVLALVVPVLVVVAGLGGAVTGSRVTLLDGAAWLPSTVGQVVLVSGASARPAATVAVGKSGDDLSVVQSGTTAYVVNRSAGTVTRVDGATFDTTDAVQFSADGGAQLQLLTGGGSVFVLDGANGLVYDVDPVTLASRGTPKALDVEVAPGAAVVDATGRLWVVDAVGGGISWLAADGSPQPASSGLAADHLTLAGGRPVAVGETGADWLGDDGSSDAHVDFGLRPGETAVVSGTPDGRLLAVVGSRIVELCDRSGCAAKAFPIVDAGARLGAAILMSGVILVPDFDKGAVHLIWEADGRQIASQPILNPTADFDLFDHDTFAFFNDRNSERAGILQLEGTFTRVQKYEPGDPSAGLDVAAQSQVAPVITTPPASSAGPTPLGSETTTGSTSPAGPGGTQGGGGTTGGSVGGTGGGGGGTGGGGGGTGGGTGNEGGDTGGTQTGTVGGGNGTTISEPTGTTTPDLLATEVKVDGPGMVTSDPKGIDCETDCTERFPRGSTITLTAPASSGVPVWSGSGIDCNGASCPVAAGSTVTVTFPPPPPSTDPPQTRKVTVNVINGTVSSSPEGLDSCSGVCTFAPSVVTEVKLTAKPVDGFGGGTVGGDLSSFCSGMSCTIPPGGAAVDGSFVFTPQQLVSVVINGGHGTVTSSSGRIACPAQRCEDYFDDPSAVQLKARPDTGWYAKWSNCEERATDCPADAGSNQVSFHDETPPVVFTSPPGGTVTLTASDEQSGIASTSFTVTFSVYNVCEQRYGENQTLTAPPKSGTSVEVTLETTLIAGQCGGRDEEIIIDDRGKPHRIPAQPPRTNQIRAAINEATATNGDGKTTGA